VNVIFSNPRSHPMSLLAFFVLPKSCPLHLTTPRCFSDPFLFREALPRTHSLSRGFPLCVAHRFFFPGVSPLLFLGIRRIAAPAWFFVGPKQTAFLLAAVDLFPRNLCFSFFLPNDFFSPPSAGVVAAFPHCYLYPPPKLLSSGQGLPLAYAVSVTFFVRSFVSIHVGFPLFNIFTARGWGTLAIGEPLWPLAYLIESEDFKTLCCLSFAFSGP